MSQAVAAAADILLNQHIEPLFTLNTNISVYLDSQSTQVLLSLPGGLERLFSFGADSIHELSSCFIPPIRPRSSISSAIVFLCNNSELSSSALSFLSTEYGPSNLTICFFLSNKLSEESTIEKEDEESIPKGVQIIRIPILIPFLSNFIYLPCSEFRSNFYLNKYNPSKTNVSVNDLSSSSYALLNGLKTIISDNAKLSLWAFGPDGKNHADVFRSIILNKKVNPNINNKLINSLLGGSGSTVAIVFVDRALDLIQLVCGDVNSGLLKRLFASNNGEVGLHVRASDFFLLNDEITDIPFGHNSDQEIMSWIELLVDYPADGPGMLRKKILDLGIKARILGKPTKIQFNQLLKLLKELKERPPKPGILMLIQAIAEALEEIPISQKNWESIADNLITYDATSIHNLLIKSPTNFHAKRLSIWTLLQMVQRYNSLNEIFKKGDNHEDFILIKTISKILQISLEQINEFCENLPECVPDLIKTVILSLELNPAIFTNVPLRITKSMFGFTRYLSSNETTNNKLENCEEILICVTGCVSWNEIKQFRYLTKSRKEKYSLLSGGIEGLIEI